MPTGRTQLISDDLIIVTPGALATKSAVSTTSKIDSAHDQGVKIKKCFAKMEFRAKTVNEGPLIVGYCADNLTNAEIAEFFTADPQRFEDAGQSDPANRKVMPLWVIPHIATASAPVPQTDSLYLNEVRSPGFEVIEGSLIKWFAYNADTGTLTTGILIVIVAQWLVEWLRD